jgi:hypothetical protein
MLPSQPAGCSSFFLLQGYLVRSLVFYLFWIYFSIVRYYSHVAGKEYEEALDSLFTVLSLPTPSLSLIAIKALRKCRLINLIAHKKPLDLPRFVTSAVQSYAHQRSAAYDDLTEHFRHHHLQDMVLAIETHQEALTTDQNLGLAKQALRALQDLSLQRLARAYLTCPLSVLGAALNADDSRVHKLLIDAVARKQLVAKIEGDMVRFPIVADTEVIGTGHWERLQQSAFREIHSLDQAVREMHKQVLLSPGYFRMNTSVGKGPSMTRKPMYTTMDLSP